ncbi:hypothetical protein [Aureimonas sp. SK2]|uniref:hypothetical protein n=1 Tax=Aureimonas sp. SK2 TaxID=3015992 RepID=UPI002444451C|nr:hypothetical protein [Aureimonas sp. SK2]
MNVLHTRTLASLAADLDAARADPVRAEAAVDRAERVRDKLADRARDARRVLDVALGSRPDALDDFFRGRFPR